MWCQKNHCPNKGTSTLCCRYMCSRPLHFWVLVFCIFFSLLRFPVLLWIAPCLPGCGTTLIFYNEWGTRQWPAHASHHQHSEMQPISAGICSSIIVSNNMAVGTVCYKTLRTMIKVANIIFCAKCRGKKEGRPGICLINAEYHERKLTVILYWGCLATCWLTSNQRIHVLTFQEQWKWTHIYCTPICVPTGGTDFKELWFKWVDISCYNVPSRVTWPP